MKSNMSFHKGFSLVEMLVALAVASILFYGMTTWQLLQHREIASLNEKLSETDLHKNISSALSDGSVCADIFDSNPSLTFDSTQSFPRTINLGTVPIRISAASGSPVLVQKDQAVTGLSSNLTVSDIQLQITEGPTPNTTSAPGQKYKGNWIISFDNTKLIRPMRPISILTIITADTTTKPTSKITSCTTAGGSGSVSLASVCTSCTTEGEFAYDSSTHMPIYCSQSGRWLSMAGSSGGNSQTFTSSGTFTVPGSACHITVHVVGGGGSGGGGTNEGAGAGGGGGGYSTGSYDVTPGTTYAVTVGNGAPHNPTVAWGSGNPGWAGSAGGTSSVIGTGVNITASGGGGGGSYYTYPGSGGTGNSANGTSASAMGWRWGNGGDGGRSNGPYGGSGGAGTAAAGNNGANYGAGGSGGASCYACNGGDGAKGVVVISW